MLPFGSIYFNNYRVFQKTGPKAISPLLFNLLLEINETSEIFRLNNCKQHTKISKTFNYPVRIYRTCPKRPSFKPIHFFKRIAKFNNYAFANRPTTGPDFFANANLYLRNVLGFVGKHPILQITPEEESWGLKSGKWRPLKFLALLSHFFSHILLISHC